MADHPPKHIKRKNRRRNTPVTPDDRAKMYEYFVKCQNYAAVAEKFDRSASTIFRIANDDDWRDKLTVDAQGGDLGDYKNYDVERGMQIATRLEQVARLKWIVFCRLRDRILKNQYSPSVNDFAKLVTLEKELLEDTPVADPITSAPVETTITGEPAPDAIMTIAEAKADLAKFQRRINRKSSQS